MKLDAVVMAGGKGSRMEDHLEKPLMKIKGKAMIEHVIEASKGSDMIKDTYVSVTESTPETAKFVKRLNVQAVITPGSGYIADLQYVFKKLNLQKALILTSDLPLLSSKVIDDIILHYEQNYSPSLTVVVPSWKYERLGLSARPGLKHEDHRVYPVGVNIIDGKYIDSEEIEQEILVSDQVESLVNVNTIQDLKVAEALLK